MIHYKGLAADAEVISMLEMGITAFSVNYKDEYTQLYGKAMCKVRKILSDMLTVEKAGKISSTYYTIPRNKWDRLMKTCGVTTVLRTWLRSLLTQSLATHVIVKALKQTIDELYEKGEM